MVREEVVQQVGLMDGLHRYRFPKEPQLLVAWESAGACLRGVLFALFMVRSRPPLDSS